MPKKTLKHWQVWLLMIMIAVATTVFSVALQPGAFSTSMMDLLSRPLTVPLNGFPVFALVVFCTYLFGSVWIGGSVASFVSLVLSYINLIKIEGREDAFVPADIGLFREAMQAAADYNLDLHIPYVAVMVAYCLGLLVIGLVLKSPRVRKLVRGGICVAVAVVFALSMKYVYASNTLYNSFTVPNPYHIPMVFNTLGFNYCFLHNYNLYPVSKPDGYDADMIAQWEEEYKKEAAQVDAYPNIVVIMGEAFSDVSNEDVFLWENEADNPAYVYNRIAGSQQAISGHMIVSNIAAGTANTEFDVLTGMPTTMIGETTTSSFRVVHKSLPTVYSILRDEGYSTSFLHPGNSWFYNRNNVYSYFGSDRQLFNESFDQSRQTLDGLVMDDAFFDTLHECMEAEQEPYFMYGVTIQNHQAYHYGKYPEMPAAVPLGDLRISDEAMENLSVYFRGVRDTAEMLSRLTAYADELSEPTLIVFFGDHLPNLGENFKTYRELGLSVGQNDTVEQTLSAYEVPFVIYANKAYCETNDFRGQAAALELPAPTVISSTYLGAMILELAGFEGRDAYFDFLNEARRMLPVFREKESVYMLADGTYTNAISEELYNGVVKVVDWWEYDRLK